MQYIIIYIFYSYSTMFYKNIDVLSVRMSYKRSKNVEELVL